MNEPASPQHLSREVGVFGAMMMGLGSVVGTGVFVSIGIAAGVTGPSTILAIVVAALVATCNGLSSAQLAASLPVSGGTYEYGYHWLHPALGFTAGWMFLWAKSASAATAAIGFAGYALNLVGPQLNAWIVPVALIMVAITTAVVLGGIRRSNRVNIAIVLVTLASLTAFVIMGLLSLPADPTVHLQPFFAPAANRLPTSSFLEACALMFVAFTGYGRIATLGEEVRDPQVTIPKAIVGTLIVTSLLYMAVGFVAIACVGSDFLSAATIGQAAPLEAVAMEIRRPLVARLVAVGAVTAMLGVLLNLILGLSRVVLAMGRRGDLPARLGVVQGSQATPAAAIVCVGLLIGLLTLLGNVKLTWSFSAFTVLVYYAITNLSATRLTASQRLVPAAIPWLGLVGCLSLAFWVQPKVWLAGLSLLVVGLVYQSVFRRLSMNSGPPQK